MVLKALEKSKDTILTELPGFSRCDEEDDEDDDDLMMNRRVLFPQRAADGASAGKQSSIFFFFSSRQEMAAGQQIKMTRRSRKLRPLLHNEVRGHGGPAGH